MSPLMDFAWPALAAGAVIGAVAGTTMYRRSLQGRPRAWLIGGAALLTVVAALIWSGPLGAADRFAGAVEPYVRKVLDAYEMEQINGRLQHGPLSRHIILSGAANEFQRSELVHIIENVPGVSVASWNAAKRGLPLALEGVFAALAGFLLGLFLAYLGEKHRRYNAQWNW